MLQKLKFLPHLITYAHTRTHTLVLLLLAPNIFKGSQHSDYCKGDPVINRYTQNQSVHDM